MATTPTEKNHVITVDVSGRLTLINSVSVKVQTSLAPLEHDFLVHGVPTANDAPNLVVDFQINAKTVPSRMKLTTKLTTHEPTFLRHP